MAMGHLACLPLDTDMLGVALAGCFHLFIAMLQRSKEGLGLSAMADSGPSTEVRPVFAALPLHEVMYNWGFSWISKVHNHG